jgi:hypothetical protein
METMAARQAAAGRALIRIIPKPGPLETECWQWPGAKSGEGYAYVRVGGRRGRALTLHRLLYEVLVGPVPARQELHHRCEDRGCVNPHHLEPLRKPVHGRRHRWTECGRGHPLQGGNRLRRGGCRKCRLANRRAKYHRLRAAGVPSSEATNRT